MPDPAKKIPPSTYAWEWTIRVSYLLLLDVLKPTTFVIYCHLLRFMNEKTRLAWPSWSTLERVSGVSRRTISRGLKDLENRGLIVRRRGSSSTNLYYIPPPAHVYCDFEDDNDDEVKIDDQVHNGVEADSELERYAVPKKGFYESLKARGILQDFFTNRPADERTDFTKILIEFYERQDDEVSQ